MIFMEKKKFRLNMPLVILGVIVVLLIVLVSKFAGYGRYITQEEIDSMSVPENAEIQDYDHIIALRVEDDGTFPEDDGLTTVLVLGNLLAEDKDSSDNPCNLFAKATGATVYNCAIEGSYMSSLNPYFQESEYPMDAFCFYWLANIFTGGNYYIADSAYENMEEIPEELKESIETLKNLDFRTVDIIYIMYDGSDYLAGRNVINPENPMDIQSFTGAMTAGISFIQEHYPWIRIVVMSPTYAFGVAEDGSYISSDSKIYGNKKLSAYVIEQSYTAETLGVSFVDCFYGGIHEDIASDYLTDNLHLNQAGRQLVASRMQDALKKSTQ